MSTWTLGGKRIIVVADGGKPDPKLSEHFTLDGSESIIHYFGHGSDKRQLEAYLLDNKSDIIELENFYRHGTEVTLTTPDGTPGTYIIQNFTKKKVRDISRSGYYDWLINMDLVQQSITTSGI